MDRAGWPATVHAVAKELDTADWAHDKWLNNTYQTTIKILWVWNSSLIGRKESSLGQSSLWPRICICKIEILMSSWGLSIASEQRASLVVQMVKNLPAMQKTWVWLLGQESPGEGQGNPLQYSCLENPMDRGSLVGYIQSIGLQSWTRLKWLCTYTCTVSRFKLNSILWHPSFHPILLYYILGNR